MSSASGTGHRGSAVAIVRYVAGVLAAVVRWAGILAAAILAAYVVLDLAGANPGNPITQFVRGLADPLAWQFRNLFPVTDPQWSVLVNYGAAALFWLVVSAIVVRVLRRIAG